MSSSDLPPEQSERTGQDVGPSRTGGELAKQEPERLPRRSIGDVVRGTYRDVTAPIRGAFGAVGDRYRALPRWAQGLVALLVLAGAVALPFLMPAVTDRPNYWVAILLRVGIASILVMGLNVVVGFAGLLDLGYVAFFGIGAYLYAFLASPHFGLHLPFLLALPIIVVATAISGVLIGAPTLRLRGDYLAIVT